MTEKRIQAAALRELCGGVSDMWLWRRLARDSTFPRPIYIGGRRFWKQSEILNWLDEQSNKNAA